MVNENSSALLQRSSPGDPVSPDDAQGWIDAGLRMLEDCPPGLEGVICMQQAALAFQQSMRCGQSSNDLKKALRNDLRARVTRMRADLKTT